MSTPLNALHQPLNDFFLERFGTADGSPVLFRFDRFGSAIDDDDFRDPLDPEAGYSEALARERVSDLVNRIPVDTGDGMTVVLSADPIDATYHDRILRPAEPYVPPGTSEEDRTAIIAAFGAMKSEALRTWEQLSLVSSSGMVLEFRPTETTPATWYDPGAGTWTSASFRVEGRAAPAREEPELVWRLRPDLGQLRQVLQVDTPQARPVAVADVVDRAVLRGLAEPHPATVVDLGSPPLRLVARTRPAIAPVRPLGVREAVGVLRDRPRLRVDPAERPVRTEPVARPVDGSELRAALRGLDVRKRLLVRRVLDEAAPAQEVTTPSMSVSFEYCLVNLRRLWCAHALLSDRSWRIPGHVRGDLTTAGHPGNLPLLPVGFVAVRNLRISANWSDSDRAGLGAVASLGPFQVGAVDATGTLSRDDMQVIGWMLQPLPALPPQPAPAPAAPGAPAAPPRTHTVAAGDTLWSIARAVYGDPKRWTDVLQANGLTDPSALAVGQVLVLP